MMVEKTYPMTIEGKEKLENELEELKTTKRDEVIERIKIAREFGDLSENSEYESAREEQAFIEGRISTIENMLQNAQIIDKTDGDINEVVFGCTVTFVELPDEEKETYTIVGKDEADPFAGKISNESPFAQALLGRKIGDTAVIETPGGEINVKITEIK